MTQDLDGGGTGSSNNATGNAGGGACREAINSAMADVNAGAQNVISSIESLQSEALTKLMEYELLIKEYQNQVQLLERERLQLLADVDKLKSEIKRLEDELAKGCDCDTPWPYHDPIDDAGALGEPFPSHPSLSTHG